jgi:hypothetical protein
MKACLRVIRGSILLLALAAVNSAPRGSPQSRPAVRAVPLSEEHHHHLVLENSYVRIYEVEVPAHDATLMHQHDQDDVCVVFGDSDVTNTVAGKAPLRLPLPDGTVHFSRGPFAHIVANNAGTAFRNITIVLLRPQGAEHTFFPTVEAALAGNAEHPAPLRDAHGAKQAVILETEEMRASAVNIAENCLWQPEGNGRARLVVLLDKIADSSASREPKAPMFPAGMLLWTTAATPPPVHNTGMGEMRLLVLEFTSSE